MMVTGKPHIAVLSSPGMGHIVPLFEFAKLLITHHGFHVSFLVITTGASTAQSQFFQSSTIPPDLHVINIPPVDMSGIITPDMLVLTQLCVTAEESIKHLRSILVEIKPDVFVVDLFTTQGIDVGRELGVATYVFYTSTAALLAFSLYLPTLDREVEGEFINLPEPVKVPGCRSVRTEDLLDQVRNRKIDEYKWFLFHCSRYHLATGVFENSWEDLEPVTLKALKEHPFYKNIQIPPVYAIGPLIRPDESVSERDRYILEWLNNQPEDSVLFIVFGSGGTLSTDQLKELAYGLEMSQQRFILVARKPSDASASAQYFNVGNDENNPSIYLPEGFLKRTQGVGLVVPSWAPQTAILNHRATGGFLSHCGWNSTLESLSQGVPIFAWPLYAEQKMNATTLAEEVGVAVKPRCETVETILGRNEIARVMTLLMEGDEGKKIKKRAKELKESARKALNQGGSSYNSLSSMLDLYRSKNEGNTLMSL